MSESHSTKKKLSKEGFKKLMGVYAYLLPYKFQVALSIVLLFVSTGVFFLLINFIKQIIDSKDVSRINEIAIIMAAITAVQGVISYWRIILVTKFSERALADIRNALYNKMITLPVVFFERNRVGDLSSRINSDVTQLQEMMSWSLNEMLRQVVLLIGGVILILVTNAKLGLVMISTFPITIAIAFYLGRQVRKLSRQTQDAIAAANVVVEETFQGIQIVKAFTGEWLETMRYKKHINESVDHALKVGRYRAGLATFIIMGVFGGIILMIWYGISEVAKGNIQIGELIEFTILTVTIGASVATLGDMYSRLLKTVGASERLLEILEEESEVALNEKPVSKIKQGSIEFSDIYFSYPTRADIVTLKGIGFKINKGEKIALVGPSGSGKSTITRLLLRYYEPTKGKISIDGMDITQWTKAELRSGIAIVPQEVILFGGTVKENVLYGKPNASDEEIITSLKRAYAWEFIERFPEGLQTLVGERGIQLSGGQKQRIAIARAMLKDPKILILDEATSSLDTQSEQLVQRALEELMKDRTTLIIAHRLSTIRNVDRIMVLQHGELVEEGIHDELISKSDGLYKALNEVQVQS